MTTLCKSGLAESIVYFAPDGTRFNLTNGRSTFVLTEEGTGIPPIEYITRRGPFQHGETLLDYFLSPRVVQLVIRRNNRNRSRYWIDRANLVDAIRPNRQSSPNGVSMGKLRWYLYDGERRDLDCLIREGPGFSPRDLSRWDEFSVRETLRFVAFNPILYDPSQKSQVLVNSDAQLVFPITFPIIFATTALSGNVVYTGDWIEYPTIEIAGPISSPYIQNVTTGEFISLSYNVPAGKTLIITLAYGSKTVLLNDGTELIGYISDDSDLTTFHIAPEPESPGGVNQIQVLGSDTTGATVATIKWYRRFLALVGESEL